MTEEKTAIIWRKSVYGSGKCPQCGSKLMDENGQPAKQVLLYDGEWLTCKCGLAVGKTEPYNGPAQPGTRAGRWHGPWHVGGEVFESRKGRWK